MPHTHAGTDVAEPSGHAWRPHLPLHGHKHALDDHDGHADASESSSPNVLLPADEHDSDAVYLAASAQSSTRASGLCGVDVVSKIGVGVSMPIADDTRSRYRSARAAFLRILAERKTTIKDRAMFNDTFMDIAGIVDKTATHHLNVALRQSCVTARSRLGCAPSHVHLN